MTKEISNIGQNVTSRLAVIRRRWKTVRWLEYTFYGFTVVIIGGILLASVEAFSWSSPTVRTALLMALFAAAGYFAVKSLVILLGIVLKSQKPDDVQIAEWAGNKLPHLKDRLRNAIQIIREFRSNKPGYSKDLAAESFREAAVTFADADLRGIIDCSGLYRSLKLFAGSAVFLLFLLIPSLRSAAGRLAHPMTIFERPLPFSLTLSPGDITIVEGDTLIIECRLIGGFTDEITFIKTPVSAAEEAFEIKIVTADRDSVFRFINKSVTESFKYRTQSGRVKSEEFLVEVKYPPVVRSLQVKIEPPAYTGFPVMDLDENIGDLLVFPGTGIEYEIRARGELAEAGVLWSGETNSDTFRLTPSLNEAAGNMRVFESGSYTIRLRDFEGLENRYPIEYTVEVLPDLPPVVSIVQPGMDLELSGTGILKVLIEAEDDFGLGKMEFMHRQLSPIDTDTSKMFHIKSLNFNDDVDGIHRAEFLWDLEEMTLLPGDIVEYYARVFDNDFVSGPKSAESQTFILRLPTMAEMFSEMEESENESLKDLEESLEKSREIHEEIEKAIEEIRRKSDLDWTEKRELGEKIDQQEKSLDKLEQAKESLEEIMQRAEESSLLSLELLQKYNELQKLMSEVASPELMKAMEEMQKALEQADPEQLRQAAEKFQMSQEDMLMRIEKSLEILKQLKLERQLEELAQRAEEMAERQDDIADSLAAADENKTEEQVQREQQLKQDMEDFQQQLEETSEFAAEQDSLTSEELKEIGEQSEQIPGEMEEMSGQMMSGEMQKAEKQGRQISQKLQKMSQQLLESKQSMISRKKDELAGQMMDAVRDLVSISQLQEELKRESATMSVQSPRFRDQASVQSGVREGLEKVINKLFELSQQTFFITPEIGKSLGQSGAMMESALANYTNRMPRDVSSQQTRAIEAVNRASVQILDAMQKMQRSSSSTGFSELMEQLQKMASQQAGLNQQTQDMMMPMPGEGGNMPMDQMGQMGRMAAEQRALQRAMEEAAQRAEELGGVLGDLGQASDQMGEVADSLEDRHVGERTLRLQERILSRLLDAQRSVRTQKLSKQRQSKTGQNLARRSPGEIPEDVLEEMLRRDIMRAMKEGYSPDYQKLIRDYYRAIYQKGRNN